MTFGAETWGPPLLAAGASALSGWLGGEGSKGQSKSEKQKQKLIDQLLASLTGDGPYSNLFSFDEDLFKQSFIDPAKSKFKNQIAPQIQQSYIASGQQRGTGLDDQLLRAGVDLDSMLNQYMYQEQQNAQNRSANLLSNILGQPGTPYQPSGIQNIMSGVGGYLSSPGFANQTANLFKGFGQERKGYES